MRFSVPLDSTVPNSVTLDVKANSQEKVSNNLELDTTLIEYISTLLARGGMVKKTQPKLVGRLCSAPLLLCASASLKRFCFLQSSTILREQGKSGEQDRYQKDKQRRWTRLSTSISRISLTFGKRHGKGDTKCRERAGSPFEAPELETCCHPQASVPTSVPSISSVPAKCSRGWDPVPGARPCEDSGRATTVLKFSEQFILPCAPFLSGWLEDWTAQCPPKQAALEPLRGSYKKGCIRNTHLLVQANVFSRVLQELQQKGNLCFQPPGCMICLSPASLICSCYQQPLALSPHLLLHPSHSNGHITGKDLALEMESQRLSENLKGVVKTVHYVILVPLHSTQVEQPGNSLTLKLPSQLKTFLCSTATLIKNIILH